MPHQPNLDTVEIEVVFYPVFGLKTDKPNTGTLPRIFQHGTINGAPASKCILYRDYPASWPFGKFAEEQSRAEFDAIVARYDADPRWSRTQF